MDEPQRDGGAEAGVRMWLASQGYPLEMRTARAMRKAGSLSGAATTTSTQRQGRRANSTSRPPATSPLGKSSTPRCALSSSARPPRQGSSGSAYGAMLSSRPHELGTTACSCASSAKV